jgi:hypothetical protein
MQYNIIQVTLCDGIVEQEVGGTLIREDELVVMAGAE